MNMQRICWRRSFWQLPPSCRRSVSQAAAARPFENNGPPPQRRRPVFTAPHLFNPELDAYIRTNGIHDREDPTNNGRRLYSANGIATAWFKYQERMLYYVNARVQERGLEGDIKDIVVSSARDPRQAALFNHASMAYNNDFFFKGILMAPPQPTSGESVIPDTLRRALEADFSSIDNLKQEMLTMAEAMFGPGFVWLVRVSTARMDNTGSSDKKFMLLPTYIAGSPLAGAHNRRQPIDMNTQNVQAAENAGGMEGLSRAQYPQHHTPQNSVGSFGPLANRGASQPAYGGVNVTPCLCVSTWEHTFLQDWKLMKRAFLERWWQFVNWERVMTLSDVERDGSHKVGYYGAQGSYASRR